MQDSDANAPNLECLPIPLSQSVDAIEAAAAAAGIRWGSCHYRSSSRLGCCDPDEVTKASLLTQMMIRTKTTNPHARVFTVIRNSCDVCVSAFYHRIQDADHSLPQSSMHGSRTRSNDSSNKQGRAKRIAIDALFYGRERISGIFFMGQFLDIGAQ